MRDDPCAMDFNPCSNKVESNIVRINLTWGKIFKEDMVTFLFN